MKDFAKAFYLSEAWRSTRDAYLKSVGGLCELCLKDGLITPAEIVHHRIPLDASNIDNEKIALGFDNLCCVCREHHAQLHKKDRKGWRYVVGDDGRVIPI